MEDMSNILELRDISKYFGSIHALENVQFELKKGQVHALMGENGAGKSTLIKVITGAHRPDHGKIIMDGGEVVFSAPSDAMEQGIACIYQHNTSFPDLSVTENIFMGQEIYNKAKMYDWRAMHKKAREMLSPLTDTINVKSEMSALSVAQRQLVAIATAISRSARIIIMDEPTSALTTSESQNLYEIVRHLRDRGISVIFITHKFEDMYAVASRVSVLRDGQYIGSWDIDEISRAELIKAMVGRTLEQMYPEKRAVVQDQVVLDVKNLSAFGYFSGMSLNVRKGEIVALTGLVGAGRTEFSQSVYGIAPHNGGEIYVEGKKANIRNSADAVRLGIGLLPENRQEYGMFSQLQLFKNITSASLDKFTKRGALNEAMERDVACKSAQMVLLKARDILDFPTSLSGGNQQKMVLAKMLSCDLKVLILDEPTQGIDVGAKFSIYEIMDELAARGYGILMISSDMSEVLGIADRVYVMRKGHITAELDAASTSSQEILDAAI